METLVENFASSEALADYLMETCSGDGLEVLIIHTYIFFSSFLYSCDECSSG